VIEARALLLADGSSDEPLGRHVEALARQHEVRLVVAAPGFDGMTEPPGRRVIDRLERILRIDEDFDILIVHRDAERASADHRLEEIRVAAMSCGVAWPAIPVIPVRMTEAWLLLDEAEIRQVAGRPTGRAPLDLPPLVKVEAHPDPKATLQQALAVASGLSGRRLKEFKRDFPQYRRQLLDRLDLSGPVRQLNAWQALERATHDAMLRFRAGRA
jgi:hypothetical protein